MRKIILAALLALAPNLAAAQFAVVAPTAPLTDNGDRIATTAWVNNFIGLGLPLASGKIWIGSAGNLATPQTPSGDCTISISGILTCLKTNGVIFAPLATKVSPVCSDLTNASAFCSGTDAAGLTGTVASARIAGSYTGITGVGTIAAGVWNGTAIANANLANSATTVDGQTCTLGSTCTTTVASQSDYAAGTWTPVITAAGTPGTPAYSVQFGSYEKIGRQVTLRGAVILSGWTGTPAGNITITGLPFANNGTAGDGGRCYFSFWTVSSSSGHITGEIIPAASAITVYNSSSTASTNLTAANTGTTPTLDFSCNYHI